MKLSKETISILKNFSEINGAIEFKPGNKLRTVHPRKIVLAEANVTEKFPVDFASAKTIFLG
jgi:hypothetical protein